MTKKTVVSFFGRTGHYANIALKKEKKTVTAEWYTNNCSALVFEKMAKEWRLLPANGMWCFLQNTI